MDDAAPLASHSPEQLPVALAGVSQALPYGCWQAPGSAPALHSETQTENTEILITDNHTDWYRL